MSARRRRSALGLLLALVAGGCAGAGPAEVEGVEGDLGRARERWEALGLEAYRYTVSRQCFCVAEAREPAVVTVRGGVVESVVREGTGSAVEAMYRDLFPSVEGLLDLLEDAVARHAHTIDVRFDAASGAPVHIWVDYDERMADEEVGFDATVPERIG